MSILSLLDGVETENDTIPKIPFLIFGEKGGGGGFETIQARYSSKASMGQARH